MASESSGGAGGDDEGIENGTEPGLRRGDIAHLVALVERRIVRRASESRGSHGGGTAAHSPSGLNDVDTIQKTGNSAKTSAAARPNA